MIQKLTIHYFSQNLDGKKKFTNFLKFNNLQEEIRQPELKWSI